VSGAPVVDIALVHHPVVDKNGKLVTTAVTNIDIHDIARSARTYGVRRFFVVTPVEASRALARRIIEHWETGFGATYNANRKDALSLVRLAPDLDGAIAEVEIETGRRPKLVVTSARPAAEALSFVRYRELLAGDPVPHLILFGTGWGLADSLLERADHRIEPIAPGGYNHLSVRAAAAVILDRVLGPR